MGNPELRRIHFDSNEAPGYAILGPLFVPTADDHHRYKATLAAGFSRQGPGCFLTAADVSVPQACTARTEETSE